MPWLLDKKKRVESQLSVGLHPLTSRKNQKTLGVGERTKRNENHDRTPVIHHVHLPQLLLLQQGVDIGVRFFQGFEGLGENGILGWGVGVSWVREESEHTSSVGGRITRVGDRGIEG